MVVIASVRDAYEQEERRAKKARSIQKKFVSGIESRVTVMWPASTAPTANLNNNMVLFPIVFMLMIKQPKFASFQFGCMIQHRCTSKSLES